MSRDAKDTIIANLKTKLTDARHEIQRLENIVAAQQDQLHRMGLGQPAFPSSLPPATPPPQSLAPIFSDIPFNQTGESDAATDTD